MRRGMLKMLDNLYHSDPDEYRCFIKDQMENIASIKEGGEDVIWLTPREGFVIETHFTKNNLDHVTGNKKMFINVCQHKAIDIPLDLKANIVHENAQQLYNLDIPLVISPKIRDFKDKCGNIDHTVDVLFNPWCIQKSVSNINFRSDLVKLSVNSVQEDLNIVLDCWKVIESSYKGGVKCTNPYPFPITLPNNKKDNDREAKGNSIISDTNSLLSAIVASKNTANETGSIKFEKDNSKAAIKLVLIEEVDSNSNSTEKDKSVFQGEIKDYEVITFEMKYFRD